MSESALRTPIAIVGMACRLPGGGCVEEFWDFLQSGGNAVGELPADRLDRDLYFDPTKGERAKTYTTLGGIVSQPSHRNHDCLLSKEEFQDFDPCHRILCEVALEAWEDAGYERQSSSEKPVGVFVGHSGGSALSTELTVGTLAEEAFDFVRDVPEFSSLPEEIQAAVVRQASQSFRKMRPKRKLGGVPELTADRAAALISHVLKLDGPTMSIDAACASSLTALILGVLAVQRGEVDTAVIGGASWAKADSLLLFSQARSASATASRPFDAAADGLIGSEGYVVLIVKTLSKAIADGDQIHAVIRGLGISSDGCGRSLWAPRKEGQCAAMERAYGTEVDPASIQYIEAHATSTQVGDATEMEAMEQFFSAHFQNGQIPVGSIKSNIGHTLETAGLASLLKVVLALKNQQIPPTINLKTLNPTIPWDRLPFYVATESVQWPIRNDGVPRRAGINAFGIGGLNVHVVVDEYQHSAVAESSADRLNQKDSAKRISHASVRTSPPKWSPRHPDEDSVVVIGRGVILPGANSVKSLADLLESGRSLLIDAPPDRWRKKLGVVPGMVKPQQSPSCRGGYLVDYAHDWKQHRIPPKQIQRANPLQFMLLDATTQALAEAEYDRRPFDRERTAVVIGSSFGSEFSNQLAVGLRLPELRRALRLALVEHGLSMAACDELLEKYEELLLGVKPALLDETGSFTTSTLASRIAKTFNLMGGALAIDAGDCSSLAALDVARNLLLSDACSLVICGTGHRCLDLMAFESLALQGRLPPSSEYSPDAMGRCFPGEGAAVVLLKRLKDVRRDGDRERAIIQSIGSASRAGESQIAIESAIRRAGSASPMTMHWEFDGPFRGYRNGAPLSDDSSRQTGSPTLADQTGYLQSAHGLVAVIAASLADSSDTSVESHALPSATGRRHGIVTRDLNGSAYCAVIETIAPTATAAARSAFGNSTVTTMDHGKINRAAGVKPALEKVRASVISQLEPHRPCSLGGKPSLGKPRPHSEANGNSTKESPITVAGLNIAPTLPRFVHTLRIGARSADELVLRLEAAQANHEEWLRDRGTYSGQDEYRLSIVTADPSALPELLKLAAARWRDPNARNALEDKGIYCCRLPSTTSRIAVLFPGQGSQTPGMLRSLLSVSSAARAQMEEADRCLAELQESSFGELAWESGDRLDVDLWTTQLSILVADVIAYAALDEIGVRPDCMAGHSFGEYAAMVASGVCTLAQAIVLTRARTRAILESGTDGTALLAVSASPHEVESMMNGHADRLFLTHFNAPERTVVGGDRHLLLEFSRHLRAHRIVSQELAIPRAFHTPLMQRAQPSLQSALEAERLRPPHTLLLSSVTNRYVADPQEIRDGLVAQLVEPVRYEQLVRRLVDDDFTILIEAGPRQVLTQLNRQILAGLPVVCLAVDHPKRSPGEQLTCIRAAMECAGVIPVATHPDRPNRTSVSSHFTNGEAIEQFDATRGREVTRASQTGTVPPRQQPISSMPIEQFDATARRRERNRRSTGKSNLVSSDFKAQLNTQSPADEKLAVHARRLDAVSDEHAVTRSQPSWSMVDIEPQDVQSPPPGSPDSLEQFLVDFIVDQTGYPPEVVDLDADLEAELGIDSIRKAQLIGELRELNVSTGPILRDVRTLRQILQLVEQNSPQTRIDFKAEEKLPDPSLALVKVQVSPQIDLGIRQQTTRAAAAYEIHDAQQQQLSSGQDHHRGLGSNESSALSSTSEIERFLIDFVVDQTGYPAEVVDLDADLEAELGIDSIRKAQLFGELREQMTMGGGESEFPSLSKFRTLRQILDLMSPTDSKEVSVAVDSAPGAHQTSRSNGVANHHVAVASPSSNAVKDPVAYDQAFQSGRSRAEKIVARLRRFADRAGDLKRPTISEDAPNDERQFTSVARDQLQGVADGAGVHPANVAAFALQYSLASLLDDSFDVGSAATISDNDVCQSTSNKFGRQPDVISEKNHCAHGGPSADFDQSKSNGARTQGKNHAVRSVAEPKVISGESLTMNHAPDSGSVTNAQVTWRHVLRMVPLPQWPDIPVAPVLHGAALILGNNAVSLALKKRLVAAGVHCHVLEPGMDPQQMVSELERIWDHEPVPHLFVVTPRDAEAVTDFDPHRWERRWSKGVITPFWLCQRWLQLVQRDQLTDEASIVGTTSLGGTFGFNGDVVSAESGALSGLMKAILIENWVNGIHTLPVKLIDTAQSAAPIEIVDAIWRELAVPSYDAEVAWRNGERSVVRAVRTPLPTTGGKPIPRGGNWVCTGGARGITAFVARELAIRYGLTLNLLGTAPAPQISDEWRDLSDAELKPLRSQIMQTARAKRLNPLKEWQAVEKAIEIDRNLRELRQLGVSVRYYQCDVSDREALAIILDRIRAEDGPIDGVLHGAGFGKDARFDQKDPDNVNKCLGAKINGAFALMDLTRDDPLKYFVAFGSISGRFGANGHTDYSAANDMLARQTAWYRTQRPDVIAVAFHWHAWGDVGMATKPETKLALEMVNMQFMPAAEGLRHLISELEAGAPEAEILITDERYYRSFFPAETLMAQNGKSAHSIVGASLPLLDSTEIVRRKGRTEAELTLDPVKEPFLIEHRLDDRPLLPLVVGMEMMCEIARAAGIGPVGRLRNVEALHGVKFHTDEPRSLRVVACSDENGDLRCSVMADVRLKNGTIVEHNRTYQQAIALPVSDPLGKIDLDVPVNGWERMEYQPRGAARMFHGSPLRCLRKLRFGNEIVWGRIVAPALVELAGSQRDVTGWMVPSAALDACLYATALLALKCVDQVQSLPHGLEQLELGRRTHPGEPCIVEARFVRRENQFAWFDFVLVGLNGDVIIRATNYRVILMNDQN